MGEGDDQGACADQVSECAKDLGAVGRIVDNLAVVLLVLGVAEEHDALDLLADSSAAVADCSSSEGGTLAVNDEVLSAILLNWCLSLGEDSEVLTCILQRQSLRWGTWCWP